MNAIAQIDKTMRAVSALTMRERLPLSLDRKNNPDMSEPTAASSKVTTMIFTVVSIEKLPFLIIN